MKRIVHKAKDFKEAEEYDIMQHRALTPEQRQRIAYLLKISIIIFCHFGARAGLCSGALCCT